jgi:hypothetical protein
MGKHYKHFMVDVTGKRVVPLHEIAGLQEEIRPGWLCKER